jgi:hypothetical protein
LVLTYALLKGSNGGVSKEDAIGGSPLALESLDHDPKLCVLLSTSDGRSAQRIPSSSLGWVAMDRSWTQENGSQQSPLAATLCFLVSSARTLYLYLVIWLAT